MLKDFESIMPDDKNALKAEIRELNEELATLPQQLKEKKLIVLKQGADPDSLNYRDYLLSADRALFNEWYNSLVKDSMSVIEKIMSFFKK